MRKRRNALDKTRKDAKELIAMIEKLPEDKKREVLGIVRGYALCAETENKDQVERIQEIYETYSQYQERNRKAQQDD